MSFSTCPVCGTKLEHIPDGVLYSCSCGKLTIDCTAEYTRYIGVPAKESVHYQEWAETNKELLTTLREKNVETK